MIIHTKCGHESDRLNHSFNRVVTFDNLCWECLKALKGTEVDFIRFGKAPEDGFSYNYRENRCEPGVSAYLVQNNEIIDTIRSEFVDKRAMYVGKGIVTGFGGDGEICVNILKIRKATKRDKSKLAESLSKQGYAHLAE